MTIQLTRQGDDLEVRIDELSIIVRDRYRRRLLSFTKGRSLSQINIDTLLSASKDLPDGEATVLKDQYKAGIDNLDKAIRESLNEIPAKEKRRILNKSINAYSRKQAERRLDDLGGKVPDMESISRGDEMNKKQAIQRLIAIQNKPAEYNSWLQESVVSQHEQHIEADEVLCDLLAGLGYDDVVKEYRKIEKRYS